MAAGERPGKARRPATSSVPGHSSATRSRARLSVLRGVHRSRDGPAQGDARHLARRSPDRAPFSVPVDQKGSAHRPARVAAALNRAAASAGIDHVAPHQLRHTLATQAINLNMSLEGARGPPRPQVAVDDPRLCPYHREDGGQRVLRPSPSRARRSTTSPRPYRPKPKGPRWSSSAGRWIGACSATATAHVPSSWTVTSSRSVSLHILRHDDRVQAHPETNPTTLKRRASSAVNASSRAPSTGWKEMQDDVLRRYGDAQLTPVPCSRAPQAHPPRSVGVGCLRRRE